LINSVLLAAIHQPHPSVTTTVAWAAVTVAFAIAAVILVVTLVGIVRGITAILDQIVDSGSKPHRSGR
jgi:hypothetical protein